MEMENITGKITDLALQYGPQLVLAIVTLFGGLWIIKRVVTVHSKGMERSKMFTCILTRRLTVVVRQLFLTNTPVVLSFQ